MFGFRRVCLLALLLSAVFSCGCAGKENPVSVYSLYENGGYETTLTPDNRYQLSTADRLIEAIKANDPVLFLIGGAWCPYCEFDVGIIDAVFRSSPVSDTIPRILYVDVADSQISDETIMSLNDEFDWTVRTRIPCLIAAKGGEVLADRNDPAFKTSPDRELQIQAFFKFLEKAVAPSP